MTDIIRDDIPILCLPDSAVCRITGQNPVDMPECPKGYKCCTGDCPCYFEEDAK